MTDDMTLLGEYARHHSEQAFAALVGRHINLVYSVALRQVGDAHLAEEITQAVFIILARKAGSLDPKIILSGWLCRTARHVSANALTVQRRRQQREQEAYMQSALNESVEAETWPQIAPLLDAALAQLGAKDHDAIVLRYLEGRSLNEVGAALGASEEAAGKRVNRALEKLRKIFTKRGVTLSTALIAGAVSANSVQAVPVSLAKTVSVVAFTKGAAAGSSIPALVKGALKLMAWTKTKTAIVTSVVLLLAAGTTTVVVSKFHSSRINEKDFWATSFPSGMPTNFFGNPATFSFGITPTSRCSISGLLDQCMQVTGNRYLVDKVVAAGGVNFGNPKVMDGKEWVAAFENALQTGTPEWWDAQRKSQRRENLVLIKFPEKKIVLVLPKDKATKYQ